jgi:hypothetical protein
VLKQRIKQFIRNIAAPAYKKEMQAIKAIAAVYQEMMQHPAANTDTGCEAIVFSKDRAMQLHALLSSYYEQVDNPAKLHILYTTSSDRHARSYEEVKKLFSGKDIHFIPERSFKKDLESLLESIPSSKLFFMTDDGLFIDRFDLRELLSFDYFQVAPSVIKGMDLTYCYIRDRKQALPAFIQPSTFNLPAGMKCWEWGNAEGGSDWAYPLSLDTTFYDTREIRAMIRQVDYKGPNSLESVLQQYYAPIFLQRKGVCYEKAKYVNIVCNVVNTEHANRNTGLHSIEALLKKWEEGYRIKYEDLYGKTCGEAEQSAFSFIRR